MVFRSPVRTNTPPPPFEEFEFSDSMASLRYGSHDETFTLPATEPQGNKVPGKEIGALLGVIRDAVGRSGNLKRDIKTEILTSVDKIQQLLTNASLPGPVDTEELKATIKECIKEEFKAIKVPAPVIRAPPTPPLSTSQPSYAKVASTSSVRDTQLRPPPFKPAIIVSAKNSTSTSDTLSAWQKNVTFRDTNFAPEKVKPVSHNKLRIEFNKPEQMEIALRKIDPSCGIEAEPSKQLRPMFILKGVANKNPIETITETLCNQNDCIKNNLKHAGDLELKFKRGNRNPNLYNAVFITTPALWKSIMEAEKLNIDHQRVHVGEFIPVLQCYRCLQYGHTRKWCKETKIACSHCSSTLHAFKDCPIKDDSSKTRCFNCDAHNRKLNITGKDTAHSATSVTCPRFISMSNVVRSRTNYGE